MDRQRWERRPPPLPPPRLNREHPSFSAALLDAIYHSLDTTTTNNNDNNKNNDNHPLSPVSPLAKPAPASVSFRRGTADGSSSPISLSLSRSLVELRRTSVSPAERPPLARRTPTHPASSFEASGFGFGFGFSVAPDTRSQRPKPPRPNRVRPDPAPFPPPTPPPRPLPPSLDEERKKKKSTASLKSRFREFRNKRSLPLPSSSSSPVSIACLLKSLFSSKKGKSSKPVPPPPPGSVVSELEPASARSILSSRASRRKSAATTVGASSTAAPARRAVRFSPVAVVLDEECRTCVENRLYDAELEVAPTTPMAVGSVAAAAERRVEELLRALGMAEEKAEKEKESSEPCSDLFELDTLSPVGSDELPAASKTKAKTKTLTMAQQLASTTC